MFRFLYFYYYSSVGNINEEFVEKGYLQYLLKLAQRGFISIVLVGFEHLFRWEVIIKKILNKKNNFAIVSSVSTAFYVSNSFAVENSSYYKLVQT